jgi:hypothetical protein
MLLAEGRRSGSLISVVKSLFFAVTPLCYTLSLRSHEVV